MVIEEFPDDQDCDKKLKTTEKKIEGGIYRNITDNEKWTNQNTLNKVAEAFPYNKTPANIK